MKLALPRILSLSSGFVALARPRAVSFTQSSPKAEQPPNQPLETDTAPYLAGELLTIEQLDAHARAIAAKHRLGPARQSIETLRQAIDSSEQIVRTAGVTLGQPGTESSALTPAATWLLDNLHVVHDQIREVRQDLPPGFYRQLPKLAEGPFVGLPRVYAIAIELIAHTDARIDAESLLRFLLAYESVSPLTIGELWATVIMLRVGLIENLGRVAAATLAAHRRRIEADSWADRLLAADSRPGDEHTAVLDELLRHYPQIPPTVGVRLLWRLQHDQLSAGIAPALERLERRLAATYGRLEDVYHAEHQEQAMHQASISNTIGSMRALSAMDWPRWFERVSRVDQELRQDPTGTYGRATFATRDRYRHELERLARRSGRPEVEVARQVIDTIRTAGSERARDVGYYLGGEGPADFERAIGYQPAFGELVRRFARRHPTAVYLGGMLAGTVGFTAGAILASGVRPRSRSAIVAAGLLALPASEVAQEVLNWGLNHLLPPRVLPRLDLENGIPAELRTIVVVPTLLLTVGSVRGQLDRLQVLALANADPHLHFALLSDFADAPTETAPEDAALLAVATRGIAELNARYGEQRFFLFHRRRVWNPQQSCFMGWERKRGKLVEFNRLLAGNAKTTYAVQIGDVSVLKQVRYVITLDADTELPRDVARALIGTLAYPLNRAVVDPRTLRVVAGYGILQPRTGVSVPAALRSRFTQLMAGVVGVDPYTSAVSNTYMDLFGEGTYAGKGIYDPAVLRQVLDERFPDNALLSHDLIEGNYARVGFLSNVELLDGFPATPAAHAARHHRWVRGDWQIVRWLLPQVPREVGHEGNPLPVMARFKIFDNLRRSLVPPAIVTLLALRWSSHSGRATSLAGPALGPFAAPLALAAVDRAIAVVRSPARRATLRSALSDLTRETARAAVNLTFLADQAWTNLDAIGRTLYRLMISRRNRLEWETAEQAEQRLGRSYEPLFRHGLPVSAAVLVLSQRAGRRWPGPSAAVAAAWLAAPAVAAWLNRAPTRPPALPRPDDRRFLRGLARRYWHFFATFVTAEGNYLAPDSFQEDPKPVIAFRTSPTNVGLQLLADLAAYDFGYLGARELTARTERVLATLERLERYRGHFLNWYDTRTLAPLPPTYVSTVDSGNLAGHLLTLAQGYRDLRHEPIIGRRAIDGLGDTLDLASADLGPSDRAIKDELDQLQASLQTIPSTIDGFRAVLEACAIRASDLAARASDGRWLRQLERQARSWLHELADLPPAFDPSCPDIPSFGQLAAENGASANPWTDLLARQDQIVSTATTLVESLDFRFLYDDQRRLFSIGYNVTSERRDGSFYDLLASEARLASFLAIARGDVPTEHWFHLGRPLTSVDNRIALVSWGGTMFEYLMPLLVMRSYPQTLLAETYDAVVAGQIAYGREKDVPWGISESAFEARDASQNYQYRSFGVPGLGLRSGLANDLVVAPYATALAALVRSAEALANLRTLLAQGMGGAYGLYEAIDYTRSHLPAGARRSIIHSYMAHHHGMSLLAFDNVVNQNVFQQRFHQSPLVRSAEILLEERAPRDAPALPLLETDASPTLAGGGGQTPRHVATPHTATPASHLLSNGTYRVLVTNAGSGASLCGDLAVTRWRADATRDHWGSYCYLRDTRSGATWSTTYQPTRHQSSRYDVWFFLERAEYHQTVAGIESRLVVVVSPEDNVEIRQISLANTSSEPRELELTSYAEVVLGAASADEAHPAFGNLFVETRFAPEHNLLLAKRRPRMPGPPAPVAFHTVAVSGHVLGSIQWETDRAAFIGRGRTLADPGALYTPLSQTTGAVLDPIFSLRQRVRLAPGGTAQLTFATGVAPTPDDAARLAIKYHSRWSADRVAQLALTHAQAELRDLGIDADEAQTFDRLAQSAFYPNPALRPAAGVLQQNRLGQAGLWRYGISGDYPIVVVEIGRRAELPLVRELNLAHQYWRQKRLTVELVILVDQPASYQAGLVGEALDVLHRGRSTIWLNRRGGIFVLNRQTIPDEDGVLLQTVACATLLGRRGSLRDQLPRTVPEPVEPSAEQKPIELSAAAEDTPVRLPSIALQHANVFGGVSPDGREYVLDLDPNLPTPMPWVNVVTNEVCGFVVSESGSGFTWVGNSQQNRLTPWSNDPVTDPAGEAIYLRDEATGAFWSPTPRPAGQGQFRARHGFGYSAFEHVHAGIWSELTSFVPPADPVKVFRLCLRNDSDRPRRLTATFFAEWVLGTDRAGMAPFVVTAFDDATSAVLARNTYNQRFPGQFAFAAASVPIGSATGDRRAFIGRNGDLAAPAGIRARDLDRQFGAGLDPGAALRCPIDLAPGEAREVAFFLGQADDLPSTRDVLARYRSPGLVSAALAAATRQWDERLGGVLVRTPEPTMDLLLNGWLLYQTLACRVWARSAFYQSGGAFGFRDQLQDVLALIQAAPEVARAHLLRATSRQFVEGDVQHWWHPGRGDGVRTRCSDDYLWLPFVAHQYVQTTGDGAVLDEMVPFLAGPALAPDETESYGQPAPAAESASLYEHCVRAIELALTRRGPHGLPTIGSGDWNDGMNLVGPAGIGESIWVGWFLGLNLRQVADLAEARGEGERAQRYRAAAERLEAALESSGWDGEWYRRAYFDDGTPLGSASNPECQIDSLAQSWAVISGLANPERARRAMASLEARLVDDESRLIKLLAPPFDRSSLEPGYIKGYVPGVRENGGQYTHAAIWVAWAHARLGNGKRAAELFALLDPIKHAAAGTGRYKVEPYVVAADVYAVPPHVGRGGWTWYTGSAGWLYRLGIEEILGLKRRGDILRIDPCIPPEWPRFDVTYRVGRSTYQITVRNPRGVSGGVGSTEIDQQPASPGEIPLIDDGLVHQVEVVLSGVRVASTLD
jgi:cellobiose phosphorylase